MGHIAELVVAWAALGLAIALVVGVAGLVIRSMGNRKWTTVSVVEGAFAIGVVMGFVVLVFAQILG